MNRFFGSMIAELRQHFALGNMVTRLLLINVVGWVVINVIGILLRLPVIERYVSFDEFLRWFSISENFTSNLIRPWSLLTHEFLHKEFPHLFWNMIAFAWAGRIVSDLLGEKRVLPIYILSALSGAFLYFAYAQFSFSDGYAYGASAAVMGFVAAAAFIAPEFEINVLFLGNIKVKYIAALIVFLDVIAISNQIRFCGGSIAHLGGALMGYFYVAQLQNGIEVGKPLIRLINFLNNLIQKTVYKKTFQQKETFKKQHDTGGGQPPSESAPSPAPEDEKQLKLNQILDKIKEFGYESLSAEEKSYLFNADKK